MMPTQESPHRCHGCPLEYGLLIGGTVTIRNGTLYQGREPIEADPLAWLLENCVLTDDQRTWLPYVLAASAEMSSANVPGRAE